MIAKAGLQKEIKLGFLREACRELPGFEGTSIDWVPSPHALGYRRRARLAVKDVHGKGRVLVGFRERHAPFITDMHLCEILAPPVDSMIDALSELVGALSISARLPQVEVSVADNATALVFRVLDPPTSEDEARFREFGEQLGRRLLVTGQQRRDVVRTVAARLGDQREIRRQRTVVAKGRSEERRVGKEGRSRWSPYH